MKVKIISKECIKPSTPTPLHLKTYKLSFLDQFSLSTYVHGVLFYPCISIDEIKQRANLLKNSLSQTLCGFYPLAGKIIDGLSIDCNDEGVYYVESQVESSMLKFLSQPDNSLIQKFLPCNPCLNASLTGAHVALVQSNVFECGGVAIGISLNHMIFDGVGISAFLKCWGDIARGHVGRNPDFITAPSLFPQNESYPKELSLVGMFTPFFHPGKIVTKRFVLDSDALARLKVRATSALLQNPTRVEVVSALIWKCAVAAFRANSGTQKSSLISHNVNMRQRTALPVSKNTMGNIFTTFLILHPHGEASDKTELGQLARAIRETKNTLKSDPLKPFAGDEGFSNFCEDYLKTTSEILSSAARGSGYGADDFIAFTSWINFGTYELDFGWGKPAWVTVDVLCQDEAPAVLNVVVLNDTKWGGIEAWVSLDEKDMALLQRNEELLEFCLLDPSPLRVAILPSNIV